MRVCLFVCCLFWVSAVAMEPLDCASRTADSMVPSDPRIRVEGFSEAALSNPGTKKQILEQQSQAAIFLAFVDENHDGGSLLKPPARVVIRPASARAPWTVVADFLTGSPYRVQQYPETETLILRMPWYPVLHFKPLSAGALTDYFYRGRHLDRVDRIALRVRKRLRDFSGLKEQKIQAIRQEIAKAASEAASRVEALLEKIKDENLGTAAIRVNIGGLVQGEVSLAAADQAYVEGWNSDVLIKLLETAKTHLESGHTTDELLEAASRTAEQYLSHTRNVWDWRISVAPFIIRSQDVGQIHTWGDSAANASRFVAGPQNRTWFLHLNLGWLVVDTLDDYDIRVFNQISIHQGAEMAVALSRAISELKALRPTNGS